MAESGRPSVQEHEESEQSQEANSKIPIFIEEGERKMTSKNLDDFLDLCVQKRKYLKKYGVSFPMISLDLVINELGKIKSEIYDSDDKK
jgi:hypothetical protein